MGGIADITVALYTKILILKKQRPLCCYGITAKSKVSLAIITAESLRSELECNLGLLCWQVPPLQ